MSSSLFIAYHDIGFESSADDWDICLYDFQLWLQNEKRALIQVIPIDDWDHWSYRILLPDRMAPFFEPDYDKFNGFPTYELALEAGLLEVLKHLSE